MKRIMKLYSRKRVRQHHRWNGMEDFLFLLLERQTTPGVSVYERSVLQLRIDTTLWAIEDITRLTPQHAALRALFQ